MAYNVHDLGDLVTVSAEFTDPTLEGNADPDVVKLSVQVRTEAGALLVDTVTYTYEEDAVIVRDGAGEYHADISADVSGVWFYRWWSTGTGQAAQENRFIVREAKAL